LLTGISVIIAAWLAIPAFGANDLAGVNVAVVVLLPLVIFDGLSGLPAAFSRLATVINSAKSVEELLDQRTESAKYSVALIPQSDLRIDFHSVIALVPGRSLQPFSGRAKPGKPLIISGKSGLGKSSLIHALLGFLDYKGNLEINGQEARLLSSEERISHFSVLLQNDHLFATSIRENLKIGDIDAQDSDLLEVLEIVELADLIREIGLDTHIQAYGYNFSGGEKQRMKLARTLLRDKPVVILDEPFEYLDINQARRISTRVFDHCKEKTLIIVSHLPLQPFK
jgi:ABC-type transport system involved in cytochrome bd biosynthesis fused ATPase/permease subunit